MFCEKHAVLAGGSSYASSTRGGSPESDERRVRDEGRARKRMTRFIDLGTTEDDVEEGVGVGADVDIR